MKWEVEYLPEAIKDIKKLDNSNRLLVRKAIQKVSSNPVSTYEGGFGHPKTTKKKLSNRKLLSFLLFRIFFT